MQILVNFEIEGNALPSGPLSSYIKLYNVGEKLSSQSQISLL